MEERRDSLDSWGCTRRSCPAIRTDEDRWPLIKRRNSFPRRWFSLTVQTEGKPRCAVAGWTVVLVAWRFRKDDGITSAPGQRYTAVQHYYHELSEEWTGAERGIWNKKEDLIVRSQRTAICLLL